MNNILITGNPKDGLYFYGPFDSHEDAVEFAESECVGDTWWVDAMVLPADYLKEQEAQERMLASELPEPPAQEAQP